LFATALACAAAAGFVFFDADIRSAVFVFDADIDADPDVIMDLIMVAGLFIPVVGLVCLLGFAGVVTGARAHPAFQAASAAQRSTQSHGDGLEAWRTHTDTRHHPSRRHPPRVPAPV
jgi:hypothetical protein